MPFPNYPDKHKAASVLTGQDMIAYRYRLGRMPKIKSPEAVILCLQRGLPERLRRKFPYRKAGKLMGDLFLLKKTKRRVAVLTNIGVGAPSIGAIAEELIAWGVKQIISISWAGGLQSNQNPGDIVICDKAIRDEGVSHHYLPPDKFVRADSQLVIRITDAFQELGIPASIGTTWTTDAPYRETSEEILEYQSEGIKTVEMEAAALFAIGQVRNIKTSAICVVGDSLANLKWEAPDDIQPIEDSLEVAYVAAIKAMDNL